MAKRHKEEEPEEAYEFVPEDFDEEAFIHKELVSFRTTGILFVWGIIAAAVSWLLYGFVEGDPGWYLGLAIAAAFGYGLKLLFPRLSVDISHWGRREWIGTGFLFFFTWLAFFIILLNPPFSDIAGPEVDVFVSPEVQFPGEALTIHVFAQDNDAMRDTLIEVLDENDEPIDAPFEAVAGHHDVAALDGLPAGAYTVHVKATDKAGHVTDVEHDFRISDAAIEVDTQGGVLDTDIDVLFVDVPASIDVFTVRADIEGGGTVYMRHDDDTGGYIARRTYEGWQDGVQNVTITVEPMNRFHANRIVEATPITVGPYQLDVQLSADEPIDTTPKTTVNPTTPPPQNIPGVGVLALGAVVVGVAVVARRRT